MFRVKLIQTLIQLDEDIFFYPKVSKFYKQKAIVENPVIFDVGANKGQSIDFFLKLYPAARIFAFEPNRGLYQKLVAKYKEKPNVRLYNNGVSDKTGSLLFYENVMDETSSFEPPNLESEYLARKAKILGVAKEDIIANRYEVPVVSLTEFARKEGFKKVDILKVDVEGHEISVFKGLFTDPSFKLDVGYIQFEHHEDDMYKNNFRDIEVLLTANGFVQNGKIKHGFGDFYEVFFNSGK